MATVEKTVRFYNTILIDSQEKRRSVEPDFWQRLIATLASWDFNARSGPVNGVDYFGRAVSPTRPPLPHLQVERIRDLAEQLNRSNVSSGAVTPLDFSDPDDRVSEPTLIVPFGQNGKVAIMSPAVQGTRPETLSKWLTIILGLPQNGLSLELVAVVDPNVLEKIQQADGAVMLEIHLDPESTLPDNGGGPVGDAFRSAQSQNLGDTRVALRFSLGRSGGTASVRDALRKGALWVAENAFTTRAKVKLASTNPEGRLIRDEARNLFQDRIAKQVSFETTPGRRATEEEMLTAIGEAIVEFTQSSASIPNTAAGTVGTAKVSF